MSSGILIVGGRKAKYESGQLKYPGFEILKSAELFNPHTRLKCSVGNLKNAFGKRGHSMWNNIICGGPNETARTCEKFQPSSRIGTFTELPVTLVEDRMFHSCWGLKSGDVLLLGGSGENAKKTAERVSADGSSSSFAFYLKYYLM